jgi:hypothetical protein
MREIFYMGPLKTSTTRDGDTKISFLMETLVGPGMREAICSKLESMAYKQVMAKIELVQKAIDTETGEVV